MDYYTACICYWNYSQILQDKYLYSFTQNLKLNKKVSMKFPEYDVVIIIEDWYNTVLGRSNVGAELPKFALLRMRKELLI